MSDVVVVAIPAADDPVWKVSSEKVPHMTMLFLRGPLENEENTIRFIQHAAATSLSRFGLSVDRRGKLGEDEADVLFFRKRFGFKELLDFRAFLLTNTDILTAYRKAEQHSTWTPHVTLGYPKTPAKPNPSDYGLSWVNFDRIAIWTGDYDGPEFVLKEDDDMVVDLNGTWSIQETGEYLEHHGVKGMKWGVINKDKGSSSPSRPAAKKSVTSKAPAKPISEKRIAKAKKTDAQIKELDKFIKDREKERDALPEKARIRRRAAIQDINFYKNWRDDLAERSDDLKSGRLTDTQKKLIVYGVLTTAVVGAGAYIAYTGEANRKAVAKTMGDGFDDFLLSPEGKTFRISNLKETGPVHEFTYVNGLLNDARKYKGAFGARTNKIGVRNPIKIAGADTARAILDDIADAPIDRSKYKVAASFTGSPVATLRDVVIASTGFGNGSTGITSNAHWLARGGPAATASAANAYPGYAEFIRDQFIARGYNGMIDLNNFQSLADMPMILFKDSANLIYHSELGQQMDDGTESLEDVLMHYGVRGMKWGVRKSESYQKRADTASSRASTAKTGGERRHQTKKANQLQKNADYYKRRDAKRVEKLDKKFGKKFDKDRTSLKSTIKIYNDAARRTNAVDIERINNKPEYKDQDFTRDTPLRRKYYAEHEKAFLDNLEKAAADFGGTNASGTKKYGVMENQDGSWDLILRDVQHADESVSRIKVTYDALGHILKVEFDDDSLTQSLLDSDNLDDILMHYGVRGMKWGVRRPVGPDGRIKNTPGGSSKGGSKKSTSKTTSEPKKPRIKTQAQRRKELDELLDQLTTKEIQEINNRVRATQEYRRLQKEEQLRLRSSKKKFADWLLGINQPKQKKKGSNLKDGIEVAKLTREIMKDVIAAKELTSGG